MKTLDDYIKDVWDAEGVLNKQTAMLRLIAESDGKHETKAKFRTQATECKSPLTLDKMAVNYSMSGEGLKVVR